VLRTIKDLFNIKPFLITPPYEHGVVNLKPIKDLKSACFDKNRKRFNVINLQFNDFVGHSFPERIHDPLRKLDLEMPKEYSKF
jgi:hypothetical protein